MPFSTTIHATNQQDLRQQWRTTPELFKQLNQVFHFTVDACATKENTLLPRFWTDCLNEDWSQERVFVNPPFKLSGQILAKAPTAKLAVFLLPITCLTTRYFEKYPPQWVAIPNKRIPFLCPPGLKVNTCSPSLGTVFLIYNSTEAEIEALGELYTVLGTCYQASNSL